LFRGGQVRATRRRQRRIEGLFEQEAAAGSDPRPPQREDRRPGDALMAPTTPYTQDLGDREPLSAMRDTIERVRRLTERWRADRFAQSYAPGKWAARQILAHLAQCELAFGTRARMALTTPGYVAQSFDQDL